MGLSSMPSPGESILGIICVNIANTINILNTIINIFKAIIRFLLHLVGIHLSSETTEPQSDANPQRLLEKFRKQAPPTRFRYCNNVHQECRICLTLFEPKSVINKLWCGHIFHKNCLEKWLIKWNFTCPLCRAPVMVDEERGGRNQLLRLVRRHNRRRR
ncbi:RING-type E3 ubiquitin transferase [Ranunculus cassubicifolius]